MYKVSWLVKTFALLTLTVQAFHASKMLLRMCVTPIRPLFKRQWRKWIWLTGCLMTLGLVLVMIPYMEISDMDYIIFEEDFSKFMYPQVWSLTHFTHLKSSLRRQITRQPFSERFLKTQAGKLANQKY